MEGAKSRVVLEDWLHNVVDGSIIDMVIQVTLQHPGCVAGTTLLTHQTFLTDVKIPAGFNIATIYRVRKQTINQTVWLQATEQTSVDGHRPFSVSQLMRMNETCSGMGFVDGGYEECGVTISSLNDMNIRFSQWAHNSGRKVVTGDVCLPTTVQQIAKQPRSSLSSGVSCQPWSTLGDMRGGADNRAQSLPGTLKAAYLLQVPVLVLECTKVAATAEWVQDMLKQFCHDTGYVLHQSILHLDEVWISQRTRWWATISHPALGVKAIPDLPKLSFKPSFLHVFPKLVPMSVEDEAELALDQQELRQFYSSRGGISKHLVKYEKPLPTATHSWGSQAKGCQCGCRFSGFSSDRLETKGLYGQIIPIKGVVDMGDFVADCMRHMHPAEVALAIGIMPQKVGKAGFLRLELAGVGQSASPIQSLWVYSNLICNVYAKFGITITKTPQDLLRDYGKKLFEARDQLLQLSAPKTRYMKLFEEAWDKIGEQQSNPKVVEEFTGDSEAGEVTIGKTDSCSFVPASVPDLASIPIPFLQKKTAPGPTEVALKHPSLGPKRRLEEDHSERVFHQTTFDDALLQHVKHVEQKEWRHNQQELFDLGGVPGFESHKRQRVARGVERVVPNNRAGGSHPVTTLEVEEDGQPAKKDTDTTCVGGGETPKGDSSLRSTENEKPEESKVFVVRSNQPMQTVFFRQDLTGRQLLDASLEASETKSILMDAMGCTIDENEQCHEGQVLVIANTVQDNKVPPKLNDAKRTELLWQQKGWVEIEEMQSYLNMLESRFPHQVYKAFQLPDNPSAGIALGTSILDMAHEATQHQAERIATCVLHEYHWDPIIIQSVGDKVEVHTSREFALTMKNVCAEFWDDDIEVVGAPIPEVFDSDCGFQSLGWIESKFLDDQRDCTFTPQKATKLRWEFHEQIIQRQEDQVVQTPLVLGGAKQVMENLQKLVEEHGVAVTRSSECAAQLMTKLGQSSVEQILRAPKPWADLKARTNMLQPPVKIVTSQELQDMIRKKTDNGKPMGSKSNKKKQQHDIVELKSNQLSIPHAVFKQSDGEEIGQIHTSQIQTNSKGVMLTNIDEALPFFALTSVVSTEGVGLLVLDVEDPRIPSCHEVIRVPATCNATGEPMLVTAALLQLGGKQVTRNVPSKCLEIKEVENAVLKALVYKDQYPQDWESFIDKPVRQLLQTVPFNQIATHDVLDVWDRQYLNNRLVKTTVKDSTLFAVCIRVTKQAAEILMEHCGKDGIYLEPRNPTGRMPDPECQVIWLHKKSYPEAMLAKQTTPNSPTLVRSGDRYGLRVSQACAESVHAMHRPDIAFVPGAEMKRFKVAPVPYGSTKQSLSAVFQQWGWQARPIGPQGQTKDRLGMVWGVVAATPPTHWVYQLAHGDILITPEETPGNSSVIRSSPVVASDKTLQSLAKPSMQWQNDAKKGIPDPWKHHDPWSHNSNRELSNGQVASLQASLEATIDRKLQSRTNVDDGMGDDMEQRVQFLEQQVNQLTQNVNNFQQQQTHHNQSMVGQLQSVENKVEKQEINMQAFMDRKLEEQMQRIEILFSKRSRHDWLCFVGPRTQPFRDPQTKTSFSSHSILHWLAIVFFVSFCRIGEALNPGPKGETLEPMIGCINPTGLLGKSQTLAELPRGTGATIWAVSETHLSKLGCQKFQNELKIHKTGYVAQMGAAVPTKTATITSIGGKQRGVGFLSTVPCRAMTPTWTVSQWEENRVHCSCFLIGSRWVQGGVVYGFAKQPTSVTTKAKTEEMCQLVYQRLVVQSSGLRFIAGDFNQDHLGVPMMEALVNQGWVNAQLWAQQVLGKTVQPTCKMKSTKDHLYISPELACYLVDVQVQQDWFADHAVLFAKFSDLGTPPRLPLWRQPREIDWTKVKLPLTKHDKAIYDRSDTTEWYRQIASEFESRVDKNLIEQGYPPLPDNAKGRATTREVHWVTEFASPPKHGRMCDIQPNYHGCDQQHARWLRQSRRLQSYQRLVSTPFVLGSNKDDHRDRLWQSICHAPGFGRSFSRWWVDQKVAECRCFPLQPPDEMTANVLLKTMEIKLREFEKGLTKQRVAKAKQRRHDDPNLIFQDLKADAPMPVQALVEHKEAVIDHIDPDDQSFEVDQPQPWDQSLPMIVGTRRLDVIQAEPDKVWVEDVSPLAEGMTVQQEQYIGDIRQLFDRFGAEWAQRWDRHQQTPWDFWDPVIQFAKLSLQPPKPMEYEKITISQWQACLKSKWKRAATGPDAMARIDLLNMPDDITRELLELLFAVEQGRAWPQQMITGMVVALEKVHQAKQVTQFRPITIFAVAYRTWGSIRAKQLLKHLETIAPMTCAGNLPGRQASQVWMGILVEIETSWTQGTPVSGAVVDLVKAFNLLPRIPVLEILDHLLVPSPILKAWGSALVGMQRRFKLRNCAGPPLRSCTGFAEGDALSVCAMLCINLVCHEWVRRRTYSATVWSYVDNIEITSPEATTTVQGLDDLIAFAELVDVEIDESKTYVCSTNPTSRREFRQQQLPIKRWARDLGGHIQYTRQTTNCTIVSRCMKLDPVWQKLGRSLAPYSQKLRAIRAKAWPQGLHGCASTHLSDDLFDHLRTGAMKGLGVSKSGTSPAVHLSLLEPPKTDPQYHVLLETITMARTQILPEIAGFILGQIAYDKQRRPAPGPCSVILSRLQQLSWTWQHATVFKDHQGRSLDVWNQSIQEVRFCLAQGWQDRIQGIASKRKSFRGLNQISPRLTTAGLSRWQPEEQALLRASLNGTFFTEDKLKHHKKNGDGKCAFCEAGDSQAHRHWECAKFVECRQHLSPDQIDEICMMAPSVSHHGWVPEPPSLRQFQQLCSEFPDRTHSFEMPSTIPDHLWLFTDGGCKAPASYEGKWATWGVVLGSWETEQFSPIASGLVPGLVQTAARAEIMAAISACSFAYRLQTPATLCLDNDLVYKRIRKFRQRECHIKPNQKDADLWFDLQHFVRMLGDKLKLIVKVVSHQHITNDLDEADKWIFKGNSAADHLTSNVEFEYPHVRRIWKQVQKDLKCATLFREALHSTIIRVGLQAVRQHRPEYPQEAPARPARFTEADLVAVQPLVLPDDIPLRYRAENLDQVVTWWNHVTQTGDTEQVVSWFQLVALFEHMTRDRGVWYQGSSKRWYSADTGKYRNFVLRVNGFSRYIQGLYSLKEISIRVLHIKPNSSVICFWTQCVACKLGAELLRQADDILAEAQPIFRKVKELRTLD